MFIRLMYSVLPWACLLLTATISLAAQPVREDTSNKAAGARAARGFSDPATGMAFVPVPGGCFPMGDTFGDGYDWERPVHEVCVADFSIGKYEVTQGQWRRLMEENRSGFSSCGDDCPVENVTWDEVQEFIRRLNSISGGSYRLPTEGEWEYAARSGGRKEKFSGGGDVNAVAWYYENSDDTTHPVGQKKSNGLGIYDMSGNVWEWVSGCYGDYGVKTEQVPGDPSSCPGRINRGGGWGNDPRNVRTTSRRRLAPDRSYNYLGFRLAAPAVR